MFFEQVECLDFLHHRMRPKDRNLSPREISVESKAHTPRSPLAPHTPPMRGDVMFLSLSFSEFEQSACVLDCVKGRGDVRGVCFFRESLSLYLFRSLRRAVDLFKALSGHDSRIESDFCRGWSTKQVAH